MFLSIGYYLFAFDGSPVFLTICKTHCIAFVVSTSDIGSFLTKMNACHYFNIKPAIVKTRILL